jgi:hypothetical protein
MPTAAAGQVGQGTFEPGADGSHARQPPRRGTLSRTQKRVVPRSAVPLGTPS